MQDADVSSPATAMMVHECRVQKISTRASVDSSPRSPARNGNESFGGELDDLSDIILTLRSDRELPGDIPHGARLIERQHEGLIALMPNWRAKSSILFGPYLVPA